MKYFTHGRLAMSLIVIGAVIEISARTIAKNAAPGSFMGAGGAYDKLDTAVGFGNVGGTGVDLSPGLELILIGIALYAWKHFAR